MIEETISAITPLDSLAMAVCQERLDNLTKPLHSLEGFENLAVLLAGITGNPRPREIKAGLILMLGDEGVESERGQDSQELIQDFLNDACPIKVMAEHLAADITLVDIGAAAELSALTIRHEKIAYGTHNFTKEAAMSLEEARRAVTTGIKLAQEAAERGCFVLGIGGLKPEGSLASLAVIAACSGKRAKELIGPSNSGNEKILEHALNFNMANPVDPWDILRKLASFEIAGLIGVILGAAAAKAAVVLDGLLASAAALIAIKLAPQAKAYLIGTHEVPGPAHKEALAILGLPAYLELDLTIGQGVGAALGISLLCASLHMLNDMMTFNEAKVAVAEDGPGAVKQKA